MIPFYFGSHDKQLFGVYHQPKHYPSFSHGVLLCPPIGHEYMRTHLVFQQLAVNLSTVGFDVLKFDYYGVGDSAGDSDQGHIEIWESNIIEAYQELKDISGVQSISFVGLRIGASLAFSAVSNGLNAKNVILWDPVINGNDYIQGLKNLTMKVLKGRTETEKDGYDVLVGFPYSTQNLNKISNLNLLNLNIGTKLNIYIILSEYLNDYFTFHNHLQSLGIDIEMIDLFDVNNLKMTNSKGDSAIEYDKAVTQWSNSDDFDQALLSPLAVTEIVATLKTLT